MNIYLLNSFSYSEVATVGGFEPERFICNGAWLWYCVHSCCRARAGEYSVLKNVLGFFAVGQFAVRKKRLFSVKLGQIRFGFVWLFFIPYDKLSYREKS